MNQLKSRGSIFYEKKYYWFGTFSIVAVLIGIVGGIGIIWLKNVGENAKKMYEQNLMNVYELTL